MTSRHNPIYSYIRFVLDQLDVTPSKLAKDAGVSSSTLTRFMNDPNYKFTPSSVTVQKIAKASGISPAPYMESQDLVDDMLIPFVRKDLYDETWGPDANPDHPNAIGSTLPLGYVEAGVWRDRSIPRIEDLAPLSLINSYWGHLKTYRDFYVIVKGNALNRIVQDGEILFCSRYDQYTIGALEGQLAIVERLQDDGRLVELTARRLTRTEEGWRLAFHSTDPAFDSDVLEMGPDLRGDPEVRVLGFSNMVLRYLQTESPHHHMLKRK